MLSNLPCCRKKIIFSDNLVAGKYGVKYNHKPMRVKKKVLQLKYFDTKGILNTTNKLIVI